MVHHHPVMMEQPVLVDAPTATSCSVKTKVASTTKTTTTNSINRPEWRDAVAGAGAGAFSRTVMAPVERVKLLMQLQRTIVVESPHGVASSSHVVAAVNGQTAWQVARSVYREQGIWAFWRGNVPNVIKTAGTAALNFTLMDYYKRVAISPWLERRCSTTRQPNVDVTTTQQRHQQQQQQYRYRQMVSSLISGGLAGATATTVLYPIEFLRTRLAMDVTTSSKTSASNGGAKVGMMSVTQSILRTDGVTGLYKGYGITLAAGILYRLLHLGGYDALKMELLSWKQQRHDEQLLQTPGSTPLSSSTTTLLQLTWTERFLVAEFVTLTAGTICYPFDSVRRRMMMQAGLPVEKQMYQNSIQCMQRVWAQEGMRGFYLGLGPNIVRSLGGSVLLVAYDAFKGLL